MKAHWLRLLLALATIAMTFPGGATLARYAHENPDDWPDVWYRIALDTDGDLILGDGDGDGWHYYPTSGYYRMWFYNGPYSAARKGVLNYHVYAEPVDLDTFASADIRFNWTTPQWSQLDLGRPPLPDDVQDAAQEQQYMASEHLYAIPSSFFETIEPISNHTIEAYNPEWVSIDIKGSNVYIFRGAFHECLPKGTAVETGACCNKQTGDCYISTEAECRSPYTWLGAGTTCQDCTVTPTPTALDFGDAPDPTYPTLLAHNGPRHTIVAGVVLGKAIDSETDGQPNAAATGDDDSAADEDGVVFTSLLYPGVSAGVDVTASTQGYLNAWIDFDRDGSFAGADEQIFADETLSPGANALAFAVPDDAIPGETYARFRFNTRGLLSYDGPAADGEVEDYRVYISTYYAPHPTSGATSVTWNQPPAAPDEMEPYLFAGDSSVSALHLYRIAADDWTFGDTRPVTGIHWWGTFDGWTQAVLPSALPVAFHIGIWSDYPDPLPNVSTTYSRPDTLLWETYCMDWVWAVAGYQADPRGQGAGDVCFQFSQLLSQDQWFYPDQAGAGVYWLSISAVYDPKGLKPKHAWAWKATPHAFGGGATVIEEVTPDPAASDPASWPPAVGAQWFSGQPVSDAPGELQDMAFQFTTYGQDANGDGAITTADLATLANQWLDAN